jgi:hypothetical protein
MGVVQLDLDEILRSNGGDDGNDPLAGTHGGEQLRIRIQIRDFEHIILIDLLAVYLDQSGDMVAVKV